jgi:hypothetical protein
VLQKGDVVIVNGKDVYQQDEHQILTLNSEWIYEFVQCFYI